MPTISRRVVERGGLLAQIPEARMMDRVNSFRGCLLKDQGFFPVSLYFRSSSKPKILLEIRLRKSIYQITVYRSRTIFQLLQIVSYVQIARSSRGEMEGLSGGNLCFTAFYRVRPRAYEKP